MSSKFNRGAVPASPQQRRKIAYAAVSTILLAILAGVAAGLATRSVEAVFLAVTAVGILDVLIGLVAFGVMIVRNRFNSMR